MATTSSERSARFRARKRAEREALIASGALVPKRRARPKADPAAPIWNGVRFDASAPRERRVETRPEAPPPSVMQQARPAGRDVAPSPRYWFRSDDSNLLRPMNAAEVASWFAAKAALVAPWPSTDGVTLDDLPDPGEAWTQPERRSPGVMALARLRAGACRFPFGEPSEPGFRYCANPTEPGHSYCRDCHAVAYRKRDEAMDEPA